MKPRTEELLYFLLWTADGLMRPTWRNLTDSFESWAWRQGLGRRLAELENAQILERHPEPDLKRVVRLTEHGRRLALGGRDPIHQWSRPWDGRWRLVLFDLPTQRHDLRQQLLRVLRRSHFGYLQNSVWISPDPVVDVRKALGGSKVQADAFLVMEGRPAAGESDQEIVTAAWNFPLINRRYEEYLTVLSRVPARSSRMLDWMRRENASWKAAVGLDPLLPCGLLPAGYLGEKVFQARKKLFADLAMRTPAAPIG